MSKKNKKNSTIIETKKSGFNDQSSRWIGKFDLDNMYDINPDEVKQKQKQEEFLKQEQIKQQKNNEKNILSKELEETINRCKSPKQIGLNIAEGAIAGGSFTLPTFGYGSMFAMSNNNKTILSNIKKSFYDKPFKSWGWNLLSMLPMFLMWLFTFIIAYIVLASVGNVDFGPVIYFLGIGVSLSCVPLILMLKENSVPYSSKSIEEMKTNDQKWKWSIGIGVSSFVLVLVFGIIIRFAWNQGTNENLLHVSGFSTLSNKALIKLGVDPVISNETVLALANTQQIIILLFGSLFSGFFALLPGLSSGFGFGLMGSYRLVNEAMYVGFTGNSVSAFTNNEAWPVIIVSAIGYIAGFIASLYLVSFMLNKNERMFNSIAIWMLIGSFISSFIALSSYDYQFLGASENGVVLGISILFLILGMCACVPKLTIHFVKQKRMQKQA